jgi:hydroxyacylglutathione hydrolase
MDITTLEIRSLGNATHLVASSDGDAVVIDPPRDAWHVEAAAAERGWRITHVVESHVHNDYLTGALELRAAHRSEILAPGRGGYDFPHRPVEDGDVLLVGDVHLRARATPGHTPEHLAWDIRPTDAADDGPVAVATGGSLLSGTAGRTDLLGPAATDGLTRAQFRSLRELATLSPDVRLLPTHGAGSFCGAGAAGRERTSTVGRERADNPWLQVADEGVFVRDMLASFGAYPTYYAEMAPRNRQGPPVLGARPRPPRLDAAGLVRAMSDGVTVVDARVRQGFAAAHVPGSWNVELGDSFASYVGWHLPVDTRIALILPNPAGAAEVEAIDQLIRIGVDHLVGVLEGGIEAWVEGGGEVSSYPVLAGRDAAAAATGASAVVLDVRDPEEWSRDGTLDGAIRIPHGELVARLDELPRDVPITVACKSGARASIAASILDAHRFDVRLVASGGIADLAKSPSTARSPHP